MNDDAGCEHCLQTGDADASVKVSAYKIFAALQHEVDDVGNAISCLPNAICNLANCYFAECYLLICRTMLCATQRNCCNR